jgi:serine/threonine-protein kinase HipA
VTNSVDTYKIDIDNNALDFDVAKNVGEFFMLRSDQMDEIVLQVKSVVKNWRNIATEIGISRKEQELMESAFHQ